MIQKDNRGGMQQIVSVSNWPSDCGGRWRSGGQKGLTAGVKADWLAGKVPVRLWIGGIGPLRDMGLEPF